MIILVNIWRKKTKLNLIDNALLSIYSKYLLYVENKIYVYQIYNFFFDNLPTQSIMKYTVWIRTIQIILKNFKPWIVGIASASNFVLNIIFVFVYIEKHISIFPILLSWYMDDVISISLGMSITSIVIQNFRCIFIYV